MNNLNEILDLHTFCAEVNFNGMLNGTKHFGQNGQLHFLVSGKMRLIRPGKPEILMDRPSFVLLPKGTVHQLVTIGDEPVKLVSASVSFKISRTSLIIDSLPEIVYLLIDKSCSLSCTVQLLIREVFSQRFGREVIVNKLGELFMLQVLRYATEQGSLYEGALAAMNHPQMCKVIEAIHNSPGEHWTLNELASIAAMSRSKFAEVFKNLVGQTPNDYLTDLRLAKAQKLLQLNKPVNYIANEVGYEHGSALVRVFKKKLGVSPRQWLLQTGQPNQLRLGNL